MKCVQEKLLRYVLTRRTTLRKGKVMSRDWREGRELEMKFKVCALICAGR